MKPHNEKITTPIKTELTLPVQVPLDFNFTELKSTNFNGGSSRIYELPGGFVVKEKFIQGELNFIENEKR
ncbi:MAG TPA: hypothetical protein VGO21_05320, partial [Candidatus Paceibacterota bacterium]|nr:hypothetical protein [Candidatus Paceibacterota bacterium]